jgi:hypothetical protein
MYFQHFLPICENGRGMINLLPYKFLAAAESLQNTMDCGDNLSLKMAIT